MAGSEIQFYMTPSDERLFAEFLFSTFDCVVLKKAWFESDGPEIYDNIESFSLRFSEFLNIKNEELFWVIWFKEVCAITPSNWEVQGKIGHGVRINSQHVLQYSRCKLEGNILRDGGVAFINETYEYLTGHHNEDDLTAEQGKHLTRIFEKVRRWMKKNSVKASWDGVVTFGQHIMPGAQSFYHSGGKLNMRVIPEGYVAPNIKIPSQDLIDSETPLLKQIWDYVDLLNKKGLKSNLWIASSSRTYENLDIEKYTSKVEIEFSLRCLSKNADTSMMSGNLENGQNPKLECRRKICAYLHKGGILQTYEQSKQIIDSELEKFRIERNLPPVKI
jgi:hypothetical protein